jgi:hypothetical protein
MLEESYYIDDPA